jgi:hypothetical protein
MAVVAMVKELRDAVARDLAKNLIARFHDESHLNRFFQDQAYRVETLSPSYCVPQGSGSAWPVRMMHMDKWNEEWLASETVGFRKKA